MKYLLLVVFFFLSSGNLPAGTEDIYKFKWLDPDKDVYVLQNKIHPNKGRFYVNVGYGFNNLSDFQDSTSLHINTGYYFSEEWAFELFYNHVSNSNNKSFDAVSVDINDVPFVARINESYGALLVFSPFYGKLNTFNLIYYLDWSFGLGVGHLNLSDNYQSFIDSGSGSGGFFSGYSETAMVAKTQVRFFLSKHWLLNFDFVNYVFQAREPVRSPGSVSYDTQDTSWTRAYDFIFSVGYSF